MKSERQCWTQRVNKEDNGVDKLNKDDNGVDISCCCTIVNTVEKNTVAVTFSNFAGCVCVLACSDPDFVLADYFV